MLSDQPPDIITGLQAMADFVGVGEPQARHLMLEDGLPALEVRGVVRMSCNAYWRWRQHREAALAGE